MLFQSDIKTFFKCNEPPAEATTTISPTTKESLTTTESLISTESLATKNPVTTKFKEVKTKPTDHPTYKSLHRWLNNFLTWLLIALIVTACALLVSFIICSLFIWTKKSKFNILTILKVLFFFIL